MSLLANNGEWPNKYPGSCAVQYNLFTGLAQTNVGIWVPTHLLKDMVIEIQATNTPNAGFQLWGTLNEDPTPPGSGSGNVTTGTQLGTNITVNANQMIVVPNITKFLRLACSSFTSGLFNAILFGQVH